MQSWSKLRFGTSEWKTILKITKDELDKQVGPKYMDVKWPVKEFNILYSIFPLFRIMAVKISYLNLQMFLNWKEQQIVSNADRRKGIFSS